MKVLVTGASGFLGSHIAEHLAGAGHEVRVLVRRTSSLRFLSHFSNEQALGDVRDPQSLPAAVTGVDAVVHAAGLVKARHAADFQAVNAQGTANLLGAIEQAAPALRRFIYISSLAAHGPSPDGQPRPVDAPPAPVSAYGRTKLAGEDLTRQSAVAGRSVIFRMPVIYGPRDQGLAPFFQLARFRVAPLLMGGRNLVSLIYVVDAARAVELALMAADGVGGKVYAPEDGSAHSWRDLLSAIEKGVGRKAMRISTPRLVYGSAALASEAFGLVARRAVSLTRDKVREMAQRYWVCSAEPLKRDLGWAPQMDIVEGARVTAAWYRQHRWL